MAYKAYPRRATVSRPPPFSFDFRQHGAVSSILLSLTKSGAVVQLQIYADIAAWNRPGVLTGTLQTNQALVGVACTQGDCSKPVSLAGHGTEVTFGTGLPVPGPEGDRTEVHLLSMSFSITKTPTSSASSFGWDTNGLQLEATLPSVTVSSCSGPCLTGASAFDITYAIPAGESYNWTGGPTPTAVTPVSWNLTLGQLSAPSTVSATVVAAANRDSTLTFVSGALLGIAGGALIGAMQVFMDTEAKSSARRARKRARRGP